MFIGWVLIRAILDKNVRLEEEINPEILTRRR